MDYIRQIRLVGQFVSSLKHRQTRKNQKKSRKTEKKEQAIQRENEQKKNKQKKERTIDRQIGRQIDRQIKLERYIDKKRLNQKRLGQMGLYQIDPISKLVCQLVKKIDRQEKTKK